MNELKKLVDDWRKMADFLETFEDMAKEAEGYKSMFMIGKEIYRQCADKLEEKINETNIAKDD